MRRSFVARVYRRFVPGWLKVRIAPMILRWRRRRDALRAVDQTEGDLWDDQRIALGGSPEDLRPLTYFPGGIQNPYLRLLYAGLPEVGIQAGPLGPYEMLDRAPGSSVFHLHWTRIFQVGTGSEAEARAQSDAYVSRIESFVGRGGRLLWSVHEWLPHDCEFPEVEVALRRRLVESG